MGIAKNKSPKEKELKSLIFFFWMSSCLEKPKALTLRISSAQVQAWFFFIPFKIHKGTHNVQWNEQRCKVNLRIWSEEKETVTWQPQTSAS